MWIDEMGTCLVEQLLKQVQLGRRDENSFKHEAYTKRYDEFKKGIGIALTSKHLKHIMKTWK
ncbi:hypothetical protein AMTRI_Chr09g17160 [Amborella trichopoda]